MKEMKLKKVRRQCFVPGCRNTDSMIVTRSREGRVGVILCRTCMKELASFMSAEEEKDAIAADPAVSETAKTDGDGAEDEIKADGEGSVTAGGADGDDEKAAGGEDDADASAENNEDAASVTSDEKKTVEDEKAATDAPSVLPDDVTATAGALVEESAPPVTKTSARKPAATAKKPAAKRSSRKTSKEGAK